MRQGKRKRKPRIHIPESVQTNWRDKVHPFFLRMVDYNNKTRALLASPNTEDQEEGRRLTANPPPELIAEAERMHDAIPPSERPEHDAYLSIFGAVDAPEGGTISMGQYMMGWLAWNKYGRSIVEIIEGDQAGDEQSSRQLASVTKDYQAWRYGKLDPNKMRFKFDSDHIQLLQAGSHLGLESLSPEELADCFDALCLCGRSHDPDNLRKLRTRLAETMERLAAKSRKLDSA